MKNIVFLMNIKLNDESGRYTSDRSLPYNFSVDSWKQWCDKNNAELFVLEESGNELTLTYFDLFGKITLPIPDSFI